MGNLLEHAKEELKIAGLMDSDDDMQDAMNEHILHMVKEFEEEGHSGFSASYAMGQLKKLLNYEPLGPLTGEDWEWQDVDGDGLKQNKRCSHVFMDKNGQAYDIDGVVFRTQTGATYTCDKSLTRVEFPYTPGKPTIIDIYEKENE